MTGRILVVDPVAADRIVIKAKLTAAFYDVDIACSAAEALTAAQGAPPDLILVNGHLTDMDTACLCERLRCIPDIALLPILVTARQIDREARVAILRAGADDVMSRPIHDAALFARIRALLRELETRRELASRDLDPLPAKSAPDWGPEPAGRIGLISTQPSRAIRWQADLAALGGGRAEILDPATVLGRGPGAAAHELYVIDGDLACSIDGLSLMSELHARPHGRHSAMLLLLPHGADARAAAAFDLGAGGVLHGEVGSDELATRIELLLRRKRQTDRLRAALKEGLELALTDGLTGLHNRRFAMSRLPRMIAEPGTQLAVMMLDIDHFKTVNDRHGHAGGDTVLATVARCLRAALPEAALVARIGGEEFLAAVPIDDANCAVALAERVRLQVSGLKIALDSSPVRQSVTISVGLTMADRTRDSADAVIARADAGLYASKRRGRNRVTSVTEPVLMAR